MNRPPREEPLCAAFPFVSTEAWERRIREDLGADLEALTWHSPDGLALRPFYRAEDLPEGAPLRVLPEKRAEGTTWRIRQDLAAPDVETAREQLRAALRGGVTDLGIALRTQDTSRGLPLRTQDDFSRLVGGLDLQAQPLHLIGGPAAPSLLSMLLNEAEARGLAPEALRGSLDYDPLGQWARGAVASLDAALDDAAALLAQDTSRLSSNTSQDTSRPSPEKSTRNNGDFEGMDVIATEKGLRLLAVDARVYHEAGASAVDELACTLAHLSEYLAQLTQRGVAAETLLPRMHFIVPVGTSFLIEIGKLRALRVLFRQVASAYAPEHAAPPAFVQAETSRREETVYDPHTNLLRAATEATAAVLGGCDVLAVRPYDAAFRTPDAFGRRLARNAQLLLRLEAHLDRVADPGAGSYYLENVTDQLARKAWARFQEIEAEGGLAEALRSGSVQESIARSRAERSDAVAHRRRVLVGTNHYPDLDEEKLDEIQDTSGLSPADAQDTSQLSFQDTSQGTAPGIEPLPTYRAAADFEALRLRTERHARRAGGRRPRVFLLPVGEASVRSTRAGFARNVFGCAGFAVEEDTGFETVEEGVRAALDAGADLVALCSTDAAYPELAPEACRLLKDEAPETLVVVAGRPGEHAEALRAAGVDGFIYQGMNVLKALHAYQEKLNIP